MRPPGRETHRVCLRPHQRNVVGDPLLVQAAVCEDDERGPLDPFLLAQQAAIFASCRHSEVTLVDMAVADGHPSQRSAVVAVMRADRSIRSPFSRAAGYGAVPHAAA